MQYEKRSYDARSDAEALAKPLRKWSRLGFLRGFSGSRKEILPTGEMVLPAKAFSEVAWKSVNDFKGDVSELERRKSYIMETEEYIGQLQAKCFDAHVRNFAIGQVFDLILALVFLGLIIAQITMVGPYSYQTIGLLLLMGLKLLFLHISVKRAVRISQETFNVAHSSISLPWDSDKA